MFKNICDGDFSVKNLPNKLLDYIQFIIDKLIDIDSEHNDNITREYYKKIEKCLVNNEKINDIIKEFNEMASMNPVLNNGEIKEDIKHINVNMKNITDYMSEVKSTLDKAVHGHEKAKKQIDAFVAEHVSALFSSDDAVVIDGLESDVIANSNDIMSFIRGRVAGFDIEMDEFGARRSMFQRTAQFKMKSIPMLSKYKVDAEEEEEEDAEEEEEDDDAIEGSF